MRQEGWEAAGRRRRPWATVLGVLALVVLGGLLARPPADPAGDLRLEEEPPEEDADGEPVNEADTVAGDVAVVHALNTASLDTRVPPLRVVLEGRRLRSAVSTRGLQRLVLALEAPGSGEAQVEVRDSSTLRLVADLGTQPGPTEHLQLGIEAEAVVWLRPPRAGGPATVHRQPFEPTGRVAAVHRAIPGHRSVALPTELGPVLGVRALRGGRVAVAAAARGGVRVLVHELAGGHPESTVDVTVEGALGAAAPALVWHPRWSLLHVAHARDEGVTTVDLASGEVSTASGGGRRPMGAEVVERRATLLDDALLVVTGTLRRPVEPAGVDLVEVVSWPPLVFFAPGGAPELRWRGDPRAGGDVVAGAGARAVLGPAGGGTAAGTRLAVVAVDRERGLLDTGQEVELEGELLDVAVDAARPRLTAVRAVEGGTSVSRHGWAGGAEPVVERRFAPDAVVHLSGVVVVEGG